MALEDMVVWEERNNENQPMGYFDGVLFEHAVSRDELICLRENINTVLSEQHYTKVELGKAWDAGWRRAQWREDPINFDSLGEPLTFAQFLASLDNRRAEGR